MNRPWTKEEVQALRQNYPRGGINACYVVMPYRTEASIYSKLSDLGLRRERKPKPEKPKVWRTPFSIRRVAAKVRGMITPSTAVMLSIDRSMKPVILRKELDDEMPDAPGIVGTYVKGTRVKQVAEDIKYALRERMP